jgi:8-amino-7-oxononanoate synthase
MSLTARWTDALDGLKAQGRFRSLVPPRGTDFTSNDYLGYGSGRGPDSGRPGGAAPQTVARHPDGAAANRLTSGLASRLLHPHPVWGEVEAALAAWHGTEAALMMTSGFTANEGFLSTVIQPGDWVASDELNHASIVDGLRLARPERFVFEHNDLAQLAEGLEKAAASRPAHRELFVVTESLFGMDGDLSPLPQIVEIAERHGAHVIVDEAHSTGCFGATGSGCVDALGLRSRVLATVHTGGKALGVMGAYICGSKLLRDYLVNRCRHLIFTTALPPAVGAWWLAMLPRVKADDAGRLALHANAARFRAALAERGMPAPGCGYIVPVVLGDDARAERVATALRERGYDVRAIRPPSVPQGSARLRISIHADHTPEVLDQLAEHLAEAVRG